MEIFLNFLFAKPLQRYYIRKNNFFYHGCIVLWKK